MYKRFFKRFFDFTLSLICIIILLPVYLIVAILVRIKLGSPVIFRQIRPGKNGKLFTMYKFRSMTNAKDENGNLLPDAVRLTKFGKFLRSTSLDELPQLFNILKGDMSIVGPRPKLVRDMVFFDEIIMKRQSIRPGLTGLAQVNGRNDNTWEQTFRYDLEYVEKYNLWMDIKIILRTAVSVIRRDHINTKGMATHELYGDYLLRTNQITKEQYLEGLNKEVEILSNYKK